MEYDIFSHRFAEEILSHAYYSNALSELKRIIEECPLFIHQEKSKTNKNLSVVQQLLNTYFDRRFVCDLQWKFEPRATNTKNSDLKANYRKEYKNSASHHLRIHTEIQFGNMSRWHTDIFKFQTSYSQDMIDLGISIVPQGPLARKIDSNVAYYERCIKELASAKASITLPILIIGIKEGPEVNVIDVHKSPLGIDITNITKEGRSDNRYRIINGIIDNVRPEDITETSPIGPRADKETDHQEEIGY